MAIIPQVITEDRASGAQIIDGSLRFDSTAGDHLLRTPSTSSNRRVWTWSGWVKRQDLDVFKRLFEAGSGTSNFTTITWQGDNNSIELMSRTGGANSFRVKTARLFRDLMGWYHVTVSMNMSLAGTDKCKIYINGERITDFDDNTQPSSNTYDTFVNSTDNHFIGSASNESSTYNGYMSQIYLIDGQELGPEYFGFTDPLTNTWRPKKYTGTYGTNGFYLPFDGNSPIGEDKSGNGNNYGPVNFGGSNSIEKATGALPILNTVNGGRVATAGIRTDAYASNLFLALPLIGNTDDVSHLINNGSTQKTVATKTSVDASSLQSNFYGGSHQWNANSDFLSYSEQGNELVLGTGDFTVECWVYDDNSHDGNNNRCYIWDNRVGGSVISGPIMLAYIDGHQEWNIEVGGNSLIFDVGPSYTTERGNWHHFAATRESGTIKMWLDGVEKASTSNSSNITTNGIGIGCADTSGYGWAGYIQDFRVYKGVAKYTSNFIPASTNPDILPDTPSGVAYGSELKQITHGSVNGGVSNGDTLLVGNSSDFNFGSGDFTVELFAYHTSTAGNDTLVGMWNSGANRRTWMIDIEADQGRLRGYWSTNGSTVSNVQTATSYIARRRWNHIVFCRQGNTMRLYLNGNQEATATESGSLYNNTNDSLGILSATDAGNDPCRGHISNVRIIKGTCLYPDGTSFTPPSAPLTNVTNTVLLGCQSPTNPAEFQVGPTGTTYTTEGSVSPSAYSNQLYRLFDNNNGTFWGHTSTNSNSGYVTYTFPGSGIPFTQLEIAGSNYNSLSVKVNGVEFTNWGTNFSSPPWHDITSSVTSPLTSVSVYGNGSGQTSTMSRIRINGNILVDAVTVKESVSASTFNPFTDDINTVRGQENAYCILNPAATFNGDGADIKDGGLKFECPASGDASTRGTIPIPAGSKFYMEAKYKVAAGSGGQARLGIAQVQQGYTKSGTGMWSIDFRGSAGTIQKDDEGTVTTLTGNPSDGDTVGIKIDLATGEFRAHHRGIYYNSGNALMTGIPNVESYFFAALDGGPNRNDWEEVNFGQKPWKYPPGDGYQPLCSANLPRHTKAAVRPDKYFKTMVWSGDDTTRSMTGLGFPPDLVWIKCRNLGAYHNFTDSVRGPKVIVQSNTTTGQQKPTTHNGAIDSFDPDGFTLGTGLSYGDVNQSGRDYVGWAWKGGTPENYISPSASVLFDGSGDYLNVSDDDDFDFDGDFTIETFIYFNDVPTNTFIDFLGSSNNSAYLGSGQSGWIAAFYTLNVTGLQFRLSYQNNSAWEFELGWDYNVTPHRWYHVAYTRESGTIYCYVNGVRLTRSTTSGTESVTISSSNNAIRVGSGYATTLKQLNGYLSNLRIIKGTALYTSNFTPSSEPLTNVTNTKLLCCQSATSASAAAVAPGTFVNNGTNYSSNNQVTGSTGLANADSIFNGHLRASGLPTLNEAALVSLSSDNYILWTPTTGIPYSSKVEVFCYAPNGYGITTYYTFNGGTETSFVGGGANYNGNTWITVATGSGTINSIKLRLTRSPGQSQMGWYAVRVDGTILLNDQNGKSIGKYDNTTPTTHNPFDNYQVDGRVYATAAEAGLTAGTKASLLTGASVNTESGFSILTWTGDGATSSLSIPHGLPSLPKMVVIKKLNEAVDDWYVAHDGIQGTNYAYRMFWGPNGGALPSGSTGTTNPYYLGSQSSNDTLFLNNTTTNGGGNENNIAYVAYCWSEVPGFSKMGTYTGNGAVNGPLIDCGFRPAWVMVKVAGGSAGNSWSIWDNKRDPDNEMNLYLHPNEAQGDGSYSAMKMDFYSNGFKPRGDIVHQNSSGVKYIYTAFAEAPTFNLYGGQANAR